MAKVTEANEKWLLAGDRLRKLREKYHLSQDELAEKLPNDTRGRPRSGKTIGRLERGECQLSAEYAFLLAKALHVRPEYLLMKDDYETDQARFVGTLDLMEGWAKAVHVLIRQSAQGLGYEISCVDNTNGETVIDMDSSRLYYEVTENGTAIAAISIEDYSQLRKEISHYTSYLLKALIDKQSKKWNPFALTKRSE